MIAVTEAQLMEAVRVLRLSTPAWDLVTLGPSWLGRCEDTSG